MHDVGTSWNGISVAHEVSMGDHYGVFWEESIGVPPNGEASLRLRPYMASTGLPTEGPSLYRGTRNTSHTSSNAKCYDSKMDDVDSK